jgi:hypothetical protein
LLHTDQPYEMIPGKKPRIRITGDLAWTVLSITEYCHDDDRVQYRYDYGKKGICCSKNADNLTCDLDVNWWSNQG